MAGLIVPGNLIIENGGKLISTGDLSWGHEDIYKDGADMIINGATVRVDGDVKVGGYYRLPRHQLCNRHRIANNHN